VVNEAGAGEAEAREAKAPRGVSLSATLGATSLALVIAAAWFNANPSGLDSLWNCPWKTLLGIPCFTCGITRVYLHLAAGEIGAAIALAPLPFLLATGALAVGGWSVVARLRGGRDPDQVLGALLERRAVWLPAALLAAALWGYAVVRSLQTGAP
jgi:hypothetical protein